MNDAELDRLIAGAAVVSDAEARDWDLAGPEGHLLEALMSTTDSLDVADEADEPPIDHVRPFGRSPRPRRRLAVALAAAAMVIVAVAGATVVGGDDPDGARTGPASPGGPGSTGSSELRPAGPGETVPVAPEDAAAAEPLPRLASETEGWAITSMHADDASHGYMVIASGDRTLDVSWIPGEDYEERLRDLEATGEGTETTVADQPALTFDQGPAVASSSEPTALGETSPTSDPPLDGGEHSYVTILTIGDHTVMLTATLDPAEHEAVVDGLVQYPADTWVGVLPSGTVLPSARPAAVDEMLTGIPLPPGFDPAPLRAEAAITSRYNVGADVTGAVACRWIGSWVAARASGDQAAVQAAVDAMATSPEWPILLEMAGEGAWPGVLWQYAAALPTDAPVPGGRPMTVAESYETALGCDRQP